MGSKVKSMLKYGITLVPIMLVALTHYSCLDQINPYATIPESERWSETYLSGEPITALSKDPAGNVAVGFYYYRSYRGETTLKIETFKKDYFRSSVFLYTDVRGFTNIKSISFNSNGTAWIGTSATGLVIRTSDSVYFYSKSGGYIPSDTVNAVAVDNNGNVWIGTSNGLVRFNGTNWTPFDLRDDSVTSIAVDANNDIWVGTRNGLVRISENSRTYYYTSNGLPDNKITVVAVDSKNTVWVGTYNGLAKFNGSSWTVYNPSNSGLPSNRVTAIAGLDYKDYVWIGTEDAGVVKFDGKSEWVIYNINNAPIPGNNIAGIAIDGNGNVWVGFANIGSYRGGVKVYKARL